MSDTLLFSFPGAPGGNFPSGALVTDNTNIYGVTLLGGTFGGGTIYSAPIGGGSATILRSLQAVGSEGIAPRSGLVRSGSTLYGTTAQGGDFSNAGTIFSVSTTGTSFTTLHSFTSATEGDGCFSELLLIGSTLYGTNPLDGALGNGTVFSINTDGSNFTVMRTLTTSDGKNPYAGLVSDGTTLYGVTQAEGVNGFGTVFSIPVAGGAVTVLHDFTSANSVYSTMLLIGSTLYGTNGENPGLIFSIETNGTNFTTLHTFSGSSGGKVPNGGLVVNAGVLYGTTSSGTGAAADGVIYSINTDGTGYTELYNFQGSPTDGNTPSSTLLIYNKHFYGNTNTGGSADSGALFSFPFPSVPCFLEGTRILCSVNGVEAYIPVEHMKPGSMVRTGRDGYKKVELIGKKKIHNGDSCERDENQLYKCSKDVYTELVEDLVITGWHSLLVDELSAVHRQKTLDLFGRVFVTDKKYRLLASIDERAVPLGFKGEFTIWHFALENEDKRMNYGVYANGGLLVETCSIAAMQRNKLTLL